MDTSTSSLSALTASVDAHLLQTVGVAPAQAGTTDLMQAVAQVAREQLSRRWVATQARERETQARRVAAAVPSAA